MTPPTHFRYASGIIFLQHDTQKHQPLPDNIRYRVGGVSDPALQQFVQ